MATRLSYSWLMVSLYRPLRIEMVIMLALALVVGTALYCIGYNMLSGRSESLATATGWALVNVVPFYLAFEAAKRSPLPAGVAAALGAGLAASLLLHVLAFGLPIDFAFEALRRLPAVLLVVALVAGGRLVAEGRVAASRDATAAPLPLPPTAVDWISAAGNYVELRSPGRTILHRATLADVHDQLARHGFVRIHRSTLVRREKIARIRSVDVLLEDGTSLRTGKRYRAGLDPK